MQATEVLIPPKGHVVCRVFEGDVVREPLTREQREENAHWYGEYVRNGAKGIYLPKHVGRIVSKEVDWFEAYNLVVTTGKSLLLERLSGIGSEGPLTHMGVGNSATAAAVGDTQLGGSSPAPDLRAFDSTPTRNSLTTTHIRTYATGEGNMNWQEIALFNGGTNGTDVMFNRIAPIGAFNKTSAVSIQATVTITQS